MIVPKAVNKINARQCKVVSLTSDLAQEFIESNHRQGSVQTKGKTTNLALTYLNEIVGVAQFCFPRTKAKQRRYSVELLRLAFSADVRVVGGASKLISYYRKLYRPSDIFTYQDTTGEATNVYEHCGFSLVSQAKKKGYLVSPGKTIKTANNNRKEWFSIEQVAMRGPDALLGTKLGEIYHKNGKRKTNPEIFIEELGWHREETSGDRVYEWLNHDITFYTYKLTASDSDKYYYGVSHLKKSNASVEDCLNDGYYGSGGNRKANKFRQWRNKHEESIKKEIIGRFSTKSPAYRQEALLIDDLWKTDRLSLNSCPGGYRGGNTAVISTFKTQIKECPTHGLTKFREESCCKCVAGRTITIIDCSIHGKTKHRGRICYKCEQEKTIRMAVCTVHGETSHRGNSCFKCSSSERFFMGNCEVHGVTKFDIAGCQRCWALSSKKLKACPIHGVVKHQGNSCYSCDQERAVSLMLCDFHGETKHQGGTCSKCSTEKTITIKTCPSHGESKFHGTTCYQCETEARIVTGVCPIHGEGVFYGGKTCARCSQLKRDNVAFCEVHGETKHAGLRCRRCSAEKTAHTRFHGEKKKEACIYC